MAIVNSSLPEKCLKCNFYFLPPIYLCPKKHILCNICTQEADHVQTTSFYNLRSQYNFKSVTIVKLYCGKCSCFYLNDKGKRNLKLERLAQSKQYSCIYHSNGCQFIDSYHALENHIKICDFIIKRCCWKGCLWNGNLESLKNHLKLDHPVLKANEVELMKNDSTYSVFFEDDFFVIKTVFLEDDMKFYVFYCGIPDKYVFELHVGTEKRFFVKIKRVIKQMTHRTSVFNFQSSEIFTVDFDFVAQYIRKPYGSCEPNKFFFRIDVLEIEIIKQNRDNSPIPIEKKMKE